MIELFFRLLVGHAVADFALQSGDMARGKRRSYKVEPPPGQTYTPTWPFYLTAHALIHGGAVYLATGSVMLGIFETMAHWCIDFGKCENWYGINVDQRLHLMCKIVWLIFVLNGIV